MAISDAYVNVMCDACYEEERIDLPFVYTSLYGAGGHYDHNAACRRLPKGWITHNGRHFCEDCTEAALAGKYDDAGEPA